MATHAAQIGDAVRSFCQFCQHVNVRDTSNDALMQCIVCNMDYIDRKQLFQSLWGGEVYVNWDLLIKTQEHYTKRRQGNVLGAIGTWVNLLQLVSCGALDKLGSADKQSHRMFFLWLEAVKSVGIANPSVALRCLIAGKIISEHPPFSPLSGASEKRRFARRESPRGTTGYSPFVINFITPMQAFLNLQCCCPRPHLGLS